MGQVFAPPSRQGAVIPGVAAGVALIVALALAMRAISVGISFAAFLMVLVALVLLAAGAVAAYCAWACLRLLYTLDRGVLTIRWGLERHLVPVSCFERVVRGRATTRLAVDGLAWPGCYVGTAAAPRIGPVRVLSLHRRPAEVLFLLGPDAAYAVSTADSSGFVRALQTEMAQPAALPAPRVETEGFLRALSWRDRPVQLALAAGVVLALLATGIIFSRYAGFPDRIAMTFPADGHIGARTSLLGIPLATWLLVFVNGIAGLRLSVQRRMAALTIIFALPFLEALLVIGAATAV